MEEEKENVVFVELDFDPNDEILSDSPDTSDGELSVGDEDWTELKVNSATHFYPPEWSEEQIEAAKKEEIQKGTIFYNLNNPKTIKNKLKRWEKKHGPLPPHAFDVTIVPSDEEDPDFEMFQADYEEVETEEEEFDDPDDEDYDPKKELKDKLDFYKQTEDTTEVPPPNRLSLEEFVNGKKKRSSYFRKGVLSQGAWVKEMGDTDEYLRNGVIPSDLKGRHQIRNFERKAVSRYQLRDGELMIAKRRKRGEKMFGKHCMYSLPLMIVVRSCSRQGSWPEGPS